MKAVTRHRPRRRPRNKLLAIFGHPVRFIADKLHCLCDAPRSKRHAVTRRERLRYLTGIAFISAGSTLAYHSHHLAHEGSAHIALDAFAGLLHGCGSTPFLSVAARVLGFGD